ncbi:DUF86 domain-containing protein [Macrococcus brunensis]|uniref:DUF86 domain-containing protein n=1 Tax=Macrococcus brunensis TaxID=198483 RepID=A0A4R6BGB5_9STAP|nr:DUF86 domain-containing protein [Macrococcus brunensis]TDL98870.1 DUF86 domain-containing protein [Macrococcus brunensis]ULG74846.1 DUF86 domain-containing protein [Macrococcus brunensis]
MYFVDRDELALKLNYITRLTADFTAAEGYALERICHMLIESTVDVGNMMIDGFIMRDPGSYQDVIDIMEMEKVITSEDAKKISATLPMRQWMVRDYTQIDHSRLKSAFSDNLDAYQNFQHAVESFIERELGPVSAFGKGGSHEKV